MVEESIAKLKSRVQWLKLGDANTAYFYACLKNRQAQNQIRSLKISAGQLLQKAKYIEEEVLGFYRGYLVKLLINFRRFNKT